jgi:Lipocalin-like domain
MNRTAKTVASIVMCVLGAIGPAGALSLQDIAGTWKLLTSVRQAVGSDKVVDNLGAHPNGMLIVTAEGRFMIVETAEGRKPATTTEEFAALQKSELAYSGLITLSPDPQNPQGLKMVNHVDIAWNEEWVGTDQVRFLSLADGRLTIRTLPIKNPITGELAVATLVFERAGK